MTSSSIGMHGLDTGKVSEVLRALAGFSGLRVGEVSGVLWSDLDLTRGFVTVSRTVEEDEDGSLLAYPPKNGKARTVPLPAVACEELRVLLTAQKEYRLAKGGASAGRADWIPSETLMPDNLAAQSAQRLAHELCAKRICSMCLLATRAAVSPML